MKMVLLPSSILVLLYAFPYTRLVSAQSSSSGTYTFSNDVTAFIPSCAQTCFSSFVQANYPISVCSSTPSLDCLCSHNSTSGYTVGEGALQCIISEDNVGFCQGANATTTVVTDAYNMCFGMANALPNTHATITATLVVQTSAPSIVLVATTSAGSSFPSSITSVTSVPTTASLITANGPPTGSISLSITASASAQGQSAQTSAAAATANLTTPQIAGIAVGSGAVAILAIGGLIIFGCFRRRKILRDDGESDFGTFQEEHGNSMETMFRGPVEKKNGVFAPGGTRDGVAAKVAPPIPPPPVITDPNMFSRRSIPTEEIGIAISPDMAQGADGELGDGFGGRHPSKLLPEKPAWPKLNVVVPQQSISEPWRPRPPLARGAQIDLTAEERRDSAATQFDVDITSPVEFSRDRNNFDYGYAYTHQHGGTQLSNNWQQEQPPRSMTAPIQIAPRPLDIRKTQSHQSFSQPLQPRTAASSVYTGRGSLAPSDDGDIPRNAQQPQSYRSFNPYEKHKRESTGSLTSMESAAQVELRLPEIRTADLSPVAESPTGKSPVGRSPVSYPKIPGRLSDQFPPPKQPVFEPPWRQAEIEAAKRRAHKRQESKEPISRPIHYQDRSHSESTARRTKSPAMDAMSPLAERRGKKLGPAFNLDRGPQKESQWQVVNSRVEEPMKSPLTWQPMLTPQKIGEDLFIDVRKY